MYDFPIRLRGALAAACVLVLLAACGGGGGGDTPAPSAPPAPMAGDDGGGGRGGAPTVTAADLRAADPATVLARAASAADSLPRFGSVVQSTNRDGSGVTTDAVSATLADGGLTVKIERQGASTLTLDTADASDDSGVFASRLPEYHDYRGREWGVASIANDEATVGRIAAAWAADSPDRYIVTAGYWLHLKGDIRSLDIVDAEMGAFIDGPEFSGPPPDLPSMGTARYRGSAAGFYGNSVGTDFPDIIARGSTVLGEFAGVATLTADFSDGTVRGCIGCEGGLSLEGVFRDGSTGETENLEESSNTSIRLGAIPIDAAAGTFRGEGITVWNPDRPDNVRIVESEGRWGGRFSNIPEADGDPRWIAGTFAGRTVTAGGTRTNYVGAFNGIGQ